MVLQGVSGCPSWKPAFSPFSAFFAIFRRVRRALGKPRKRKKMPFSSDILGSPQTSDILSLTEAPLTDPTQHPRNGPETDPKQTRNGAKRTGTEPNAAKMDRNQALSRGMAGGVCRGGGGWWGLQGKTKITTLNPHLLNPDLRHYCDFFRRRNLATSIYFDCQSLA